MNNRNQTISANRGVVQFNASLNRAVYHAQKMVRESTYAAEYLEIFPTMQSPADLDIVRGEILMTPSMEYGALGAGGGQYAVNDAQTPLVFSSVNGLMARKKAFPNNKREPTLADKRKMVFRMVRVVGISMGNTSYDPNPVTMQTPPCVQTKGTTTMTNRGTDNICFADIIYVDIPSGDYLFSRVDFKSGINKTKRTLIPRPLRLLTGSHLVEESVLSLKKVFHGADLTRDDEVTESDDDDSHVAFELFKLMKLGYLVAMLTISHETVATKGHANNITASEKVFWDLGFTSVPPGSRRTPLSAHNTYTGKTWARSLQLVMAGDKSLLEDKHVTESMMNVIQETVKNALAASYHQLHKFQSRIIGRATSSAKPGDRFDIDLHIG